VLLRLTQDAVVRVAVAGRVGEREEGGAAVHQLERLDQPVRGDREAVRVVPARVGVDVEHAHTGHQLAERVVPGADELVGVHGAAA
jgi:hypothetical protein